jgi:hypothetical protein
MLRPDLRDHGRMNARFLGIPELVEVPSVAVVVDVMGLESDRAYDSERQRVSLEMKLGALP